MRLVLPRLYVILDAALLSQPQIAVTQSLLDAGVRLLQYRNKLVSARELLEKSRAMAQEARSRRATLVVNDRPDIALLAGAAGVHVGQEDVNAESARRLVGANTLIGVSTHNREQFAAAAATSADYIAIGPIFETSSKANPDPAVGIETLREVRRMTEKPIVAIGGITLERAQEVVEAGADSVAVISDILRADDPADRARQYVELLEGANHAAKA